TAPVPDNTGSSYAATTSSCVRAAAPSTRSAGGAPTPTPTTTPGAAGASTGRSRAAPAVSGTPSVATKTAPPPPTATPATPPWATGSPTHTGACPKPGTTPWRLPTRCGATTYGAANTSTPAPASPTERSAKARAPRDENAP